MGTLDDAIRQHLDLKRRAGASDSEVDRLESEAFGPARREPAEPAAAAEPPPPPAAPPVADETAPPPPPVAEPVAEPEPPAPAPVADSWLEDEPDAPEVPAQPTREFTADDVKAAAGDAPESDYVAPDEEGDDLLEETPEFLQETPEHDRLWFEQKPPRDFDFDQ